MEKRFLTIIIVIAILAIAGLLLLYYFSEPGKWKSYVAYQKVLVGLSSNEAILVLDNGQQERMFKGEIVEGMTVADVLVAASLAGNFGYQEAGWRCSLNDKEIGDQISKEIVHPKDKIVCKYQ